MNVTSGEEDRDNVHEQRWLRVVHNRDGCEWRAKKATLDPDRLLGCVVYAVWLWQLRPLARLSTDCSRLASWPCLCGHSKLGKRAM